MSVKKLRTIIISNGNFAIEVLKRIKKENDIIICADGGANNLYKTNFIPSMIVGDLDSLSLKTLKYFKDLGVLFHKFPKKKDYTDTELAINFAIEEGTKEIVLIGSTGTRLDHTLGNIMLLNKLLEKNIEAKIVDENNEIFIIDKEIKIGREKDTFVSFIPLFNSCFGVTMKGFKYETENREFSLGSTLGLSNEVMSEMGTIQIGRGIALVIKSRD